MQRKEDGRSAAAGAPQTIRVCAPVQASIEEGECWPLSPLPPPSSASVMSSDPGSMRPTPCSAPASFPCQSNLIALFRPERSPGNPSPLHHYHTRPDAATPFLSRCSALAPRACPLGIKGLESGATSLHAEKGF